MSDCNILIVGAQGIVGSAVMELCLASPAWTPLGLGRRAPEAGEAAPYRSLDIRDRRACEAGLADLHNVSRIVFSAWQRGVSPAAETETNLAMFRNVLETVDRNSRRLQHVTLLQGVKAYGSHLGPFAQPARERAPRHSGPNFYYAQQDFVEELSARREWSYTVLRPVTVCGLPLRSSMSMTTIVALYCTLCRAAGLPLQFPGTVESYDTLRQMVDAGLLAEAILWVGGAETAKAEVFNVTNGDLVRWSQLWPLFADWFDIQVGEPRAIPLSQFAERHDALWRRLVRTHGLRDGDLARCASWDHAAALFTRPYGNLLDTNKIKAAGFLGFTDSEAMFCRQFKTMAQSRLIPPLPSGKTTNGSDHREWSAA